MTTSHQQTTPSPPPLPSPPSPLRPKQALPANPYDQESHPEWYNAYEEALGYETRNAMRGSLLGYLLLEAQTEDGRDYVAQEINACNTDDETLWDLSEWYINHLLRLFKRSKGPTPQPSSHPSNPSFELEKLKQGVIVAPPANHSVAKALALCRDSYRCVISGVYDLAVDEDQDEDQDQNFALTKTQAAHIFPPSTYSRLDARYKRPYARNVSALLKAFGSIDVLKELQGKNAHQLSNIMTLRSELHELFDALAMWLEEVPGSHVENMYYVCGTRPGIFRTLPSRTVILSTETKLPLPDSRYLRLHAAVCRIARMSGAAEYIEDIDRGFDQVGVLASDGSSADYLTSRLIEICA